MEPKNEVILKSIFDGIFQKDSNSSYLVEGYKNFIRLLNGKSYAIESNLTNEEIPKNFFEIDKNWSFMNCKIQAINIDRNIVKRYGIIFILENRKYKNKISISKTFFTEIYKFNYENKSYICFTLESLKSYFEQIQKSHEIFIEYTFNNEKLTILPEKFIFTNISEFTIKKNYKYEDILLEKIEYKNVFEQPETITGKKLNLKLGLYLNLLENDFNNFEYYETEERKSFLYSLNWLFGMENYIGLCGPFGTGKTVTLLRFLINSEYTKVFYINLWTIDNTSLIYLKKLFKYESIKLFGFNFFNKNERLCPNEDLEKYQNIITAIENFNNKNDIFVLLENITNLMNSINNQNRIIIIIDQYSSKYDKENKSLNNLLTKFTEKKNIFFIVSSSMNNDDIKKNFSVSLNSKNFYNNEYTSENTYLNYYYIGSLIRLNVLNNYQNLLENKSNEFRKYLNDLGNLPLYYYQLNKKLKGDEDLDQYMIKVRCEIIDEIKRFYNKEDNIKLFTDILVILSIINSKEIFFIYELSKEILKLPLKFLEIKKEEISINDLKIYASLYNNKKLLDIVKKIEEEKNFSTINKLVKDDVHLKNFTKFINKDNFCSNYIKKISEKRKKKILGNKLFFHGKQTISIYYLDFLFPYIEEILSYVIYDIVLKTSKYIFKNLPPQSQGGFLEYIINEKVKRDKYFMDIYIQNFETIECLVPNNFYIQNYSTRIKETLKAYIENKNNKEYIENNIHEKTTFIIQRQFTGKYYDCCLLIYKRESKTYLLYLFQISKKKIAANRYYRGEHKIIFNRVKENLEIKYGIIIDEGYFSYILLSDDKDENTIKFCDDNSLKYFCFSVENVGFENGNLSFDNKSLITNNFPPHSSFSILPKNCFETDYKGKLLKMEYINEKENSFKFEKITGDLKGILNQYFVPKDNLNMKNNEFLIAGSYNEIFEVNHCFCVWMDNHKLSLIYTDKNKKVYTIKLYKFLKLSDLKYTLICSKYKINYYYKNK